MSRSDATIALAIALVAAALYVSTLPPSFGFWDTGELQTVAAILGIAHPPACPAFTLLGWLFVHAFPFGEPAWRVNLMCALASAASAGVLFATMRLLAVPRGIGAICALGFAYASDTWQYATRAEVHDLALLFSALALYFVIAFAQSGRPRDAFLCGLSTGLAASSHGVTSLLVPALLLAASKRPEARRPEVIAQTLGGLGLGLIPYVYLPLRSAWLFAHRVDPTLALGLPVGLPFWDYDHPSTWANFVHVVSGADYHIDSGFLGYLKLASYPDFGGALVMRLGYAYSVLGLVLVALGIYALVARRGRIGAAIVLAAVARVPYIQSYADLQDPHRYYLLALWCGAIAIAFGFELTVEHLELPRLGLFRSVLAAGVAGYFLVTNTHLHDFGLQRSDRGAEQFVGRVRSMTADGSVILSEWAYSSPLAYASYVRNDFGSRIAVPSSATQYENYFRRWLLEGRHVYVVSFDPYLNIAGHQVFEVDAQYGYTLYEVLH